MTFSPTFGRLFSPTFQPNSLKKADTSWWLSGGIAAANCVAAYQPKGAASYAASLVNLTGNYVYDVQMITASAVDTLTYGRLTVSSDVTRAIA